MNYFWVGVIVLFFVGAVLEFVKGNTLQALFLLQSATINITVMYMR